MNKHTHFTNVKTLTTRIVQSFGKKWYFLLNSMVRILKEMKRISSSFLFISSLQHISHAPPLRASSEGRVKKRENNTNNTVNKTMFRICTWNINFCFIWSDIDMKNDESGNGNHTLGPYIPTHGMACRPLRELPLFLRLSLLLLLLLMYLLPS